MGLMEKYAHWQCCTDSSCPAPRSGVLSITALHMDADDSSAAATPPSSAGMGKQGIDGEHEQDHWWRKTDEGTKFFGSSCASLSSMPPISEHDILDFFGCRTEDETCAWYTQEEDETNANNECNTDDEAGVPQRHTLALCGKNEGLPGCLALRHGDGARRDGEGAQRDSGSGFYQISIDSILSLSSTDERLHDIVTALKEKTSGRAHGLARHTLPRSTTF